MNDKDFVVLVVEDEKPLSDAIKAKLESYGISVTTARTVDQALGYLDDVKNIKAIWLDHYLLGKKSGLDFVAQVKASGSNHVNIPIFVVSNTASEDKVQSYLKLGVEKFYTKTEKRLDQIVSEISDYLKESDG